MDPLSSQHRKGRADPRRCSQTEMPSREMTMFLMPVSLKKNWCLGTLCLIGLVFRTGIQIAGSIPARRGWYRRLTDVLGNTKNQYNELVRLREGIPA
ncbi:hypothetical protein Y032_0539g3146 [Ancylostoma ceylanicum]|uniref:Uncharacterized protein n=1 Tax=Ancylostoma ceylanicum TaxID=53326 RepID=A0A016WRB7_9BILA|nr:hypothetical protein Y032_0539g3146 [Ancylostoma ceylanicum]